MTKSRARRILGGPNPRPVFQFLYMFRLFVSVGFLAVALLLIAFGEAPPTDVFTLD